MKNTMKKLVSLLLALALCLTLCAASAEGEAKTYKIGICNFVDDASLNQIVENIRAALADCEAESGVKFEILYDNCNADFGVMAQIIEKFISEKVDVMVGIATPVAVTMQGMTAENQIPVIFSAVSDPLSAGLVESLEAPGANLTGTSDFLDTKAVMNLIFALKPEAAKIALLYDMGQDASTTAIAEAKAYLEEKGVAFGEYNGTNTAEVQLAVDAIVTDKCDAVFTPSDNTIMAAELSIYEALAEAGIPHYTGADSFALNGAFVGYGVDSANLGVETANMIATILVAGANPADTAVLTFDNGTATVNTETCAALGLDYDTVAEAFAPLCTQVNPITTAESFSDLG